MLKINKLSLTFLFTILSTFAVTSQAESVDKSKNINLISPWTNTGSSHALGQKQSEMLAEKGWNLTNGRGYQSAGNCLNAFNVINNSDDPSIYIWEDAYHTKESGDPCYKDPIKESELVSLWYTWTEYMCRTDEDLPTIDNATGTVTLGVPPVYSFGEDELKLVEAMTNAEVKIVRYENIPSVLGGAKVGEVDYVYGMLAPNSERTKDVLSCSHNSSKATVNGTKSISESFDNIDYSYVGVAYLVSHDLDQNTINEFRKDWHETIENEEISSVFKSRSWVPPQAFSDMSRKEIYQMVIGE